MFSPQGATGEAWDWPPHGAGRGWERRRGPGAGEESVGKTPLRREGRRGLILELEMGRELRPLPEPDGGTSLASPGADGTA